MTAAAVDTAKNATAANTADAVVKPGTGEEQRAAAVADAAALGDAGASPKVRTIEGWLIKYNQPSLPFILDNGRSVYEIIVQDAFKDSVDAINAGQATIEANIEHVDDAICRIGLTGKNVKVENRPEGVYATITILGDTLSNDVFEKAKAGIVTGLSVEFDQIPGIEPAYDIAADGSYIRRLTKLRLGGFAITAGPKYPDAQIVAATESRSIKNNSKTVIAKEIAAIESNKGAAAAMQRQQQQYRYQAFLLGVRNL